MSWWKNKRSRQASSIRATRRRLREGYKNALRQKEQELAAYRDKLTAEATTARKNAEAKAQERIDVAEKRLAMVSSEVTRIRLLYEPNYTSRFTLIVTMDSNMVRYAHNLKEIAGYILDVLAIKMKQEFAQLDFSRLKPLDFGPDRTRPIFEFTPMKDPNEIS